MKEHLKALCDQIRVRLNVYGVARKKLPCIGDDSGMAAAIRLEEDFRTAVVEPLSPKPPPPALYPAVAMRPQRHRSAPLTQDREL